VSVEGSVKRAGSLCEPLIDETIVHVARGEQADAGMMMLFVVPGKEIDAVRACMFDGTKSGWEIWPARAARAASGPCKMDTSVPPFGAWQTSAFGSPRKHVAT